MKEKSPPKSLDEFEKYIRRLAHEFTRRLNSDIETETSQKSPVRSPRIDANKFLKTYAYTIGRHVHDHGLSVALTDHVSQMARQYRNHRSGFANKNPNIFVWVLRLVVIHQERKGWAQINPKTMSKYAHQLGYAALHDVHPHWLIKFLQIAGTDQEISDRLKGGVKLDIDPRWQHDRPAAKQ